MNIRLFFTFVLCLLWLPSLWGQRNLSQFDELSAAPSSTDWIYMWDLSSSKSVKVSVNNFFKALPAPTTTQLGGVKRNAGSAGQFVSGIEADGDLIYIDANFQEANPVFDQLEAGSMEDPLTFESGFNVQGKRNVKYWPMTGTTMDLTKGAEYYSATGNTTLSGLAGAVTDDIYQLAIHADASPRTTTIPTAYSPDLGTNVTQVTTLADQTTYLTYIRESGRWVVFGIPVEVSGSGSFLLSNAPLINTPTINGAVAWQDNVRQIFNPGATVAGLNVGIVLTTDPTTLVVGDLWYNLSAQKLRAYINGAVVDLGAGGGGLASTDIDTSTELGAILTDETGTGAFVRAGSPTFTGTVVMDELDVVDLFADSLVFLAADGADPQTLEWYVGSAHAANRRIGWYFADTGSSNLTFPAATMTLVGESQTQTLTNKTFNLTSNTLTATSAQMRTALSDESGTGAAIFAGGDVGAATATTPAENDNDTSIATTAYVQTEISGLGGSVGLSTYRITPLVWDDFHFLGTLSSTKNIGAFGFVGQATGTGAQASADDANLTLGYTNGFLGLESGTQASTSYATINTAGTAYQFNVTGTTAAYELEWRVLIKASSPAQSAGSDDYTIRVGFGDSTSATAPTDGCWFEFTSADTEWQIKTASNTSNVSSADSGVTVAEDTWYRLTVTVNAAADSIGFAINGTTVANSPLTTTANIPRTVNRQTGIFAQCIKGSGSTEAVLVADYCGLLTTFSASR